MKHAKHLIAITAALTMVGVLGGSVLRADDSAGAKPAVGFQAHVKAPKAKKAVTLAEQTKFADDAIPEMTAGVERITFLQNQARTERDVIKLGCVNDQLVVAKQLLNNAEDARTGFTAAVESSNAADQQTNFDVVAENSAELASARQAAEICVGKDIALAASTDVKTTTPTIAHDPTKDGDILGSDPIGTTSSRLGVPVEYVGWASPFAPS